MCLVVYVRMVLVSFCPVLFSEVSPEYTSLYLLPGDYLIVFLVRVCCFSSPSRFLLFLLPAGMCLRSLQYANEFVGIESACIS